MDVRGLRGDDAGHEQEPREGAQQGGERSEPDGSRVPMGDHVDLLVGAVT
jgi:hypothetical protein